MILFNLPGNKHLQVENLDNKLRLTVIDNGNEWVCRKETFGNMLKFMNAADSHIFKGRLQLFKQGNKISIEVKGEPVGSIDAGRLQRGLTQLKNEELAFS